MSWLNWLEHRVGYLAIHRLIPTIALLNAFVYLLNLFQPEYVYYLTLEPTRILHGEVWRIFSYIFIPQIFLSHGSPGMQPLFFLLYIWMMIWIGNSLEQAWGAFRLTVYYLLGMLGVTLVAFLLNWGQSEGNIAPFYINTSLFFAFASVYPNVQVYVLLIFPVRVKWLALISLLPLLFVFFIGDWLDKIAIVFSFLNYAVFFFPAAIAGARQHRKAQGRRMRFNADSVRADEPLHQCAVCKRTERDNPDLEFRVSSNGEEYCLEHLPKAAERA
ncbi:MAG TPA: hypothetical protein VE242_03115 [Chthoniobacterales bacterium]|nr:hypothetical protein [Chthoniobacterales bacterium]